MDSLFYVLYSPSRKAYLNENGDFGPYSQAEKFNNNRDRDLNVLNYALEDFDGRGDVKFVGPCEEGVEP